MMKPQNSQQLQSYIELIENNLYLYSKITKENEYQKDVIDAMNYSLLAGGKRIRPVLVLEFCKVCGGDVNDAISTAVALEMVHTFSLIHDDLPCMDNDDFRRGKPSCHKAYGEAIALLAGDALENLAFSVVANSSELSPKIIVEVIKELSYAIGVEGMIGGQVIDIKNENKAISKEILSKMYSCKTGALIRSACRMGCIIANASQEQLQNATIYAENLGLAFQIIDDILDVIGTQETLGKPIGSDEAQGKSTFVSLYGIEQATKMAEEYTNNALNALNNFKENEFLKELTKSLIIRKN